MKKQDNLIQKADVRKTLKLDLIKKLIAENIRDTGQLLQNIAHTNRNENQDGSSLQVCF